MVKTLQKHTGITAIGFIILATMLLYTFNLFNVSINQIVLWGLIPVSCILVFIKTRVLVPNVFMAYLLALVLWSAFTSIFATNVDMAEKSVVRMAGVYMFSYLIVYLTRSRAMTLCVATIYLIFFLNCIVYAQTHILALSDPLQQGFRLGDENLNSNLFGYFLFITTYIVYWFGFSLKRKNVRRFWRILFVLLIPLTFYIAILTASRQILLLQVPLLSILLYRRYWVRGNLAVKIFSIVVFISAIFMSTDYVINRYLESNLATRSEVAAQDDPRALLFKEAIEVGLDHPILGVGPDNFMLYSSEGVFAHNTYVELFANSGILAVILFCIMIFKFIHRSYKKWKKYKTEMYFCYFIFGVFYALDNVFYVFHINAWLMGIFIFIATLSLKENTIKQTSHNSTKLAIA